ncbi:MAG: site-specific recombinase XerD [Halioglobus sp.]|jgi:site-specific recombinase XerD
MKAKYQKKVIEITNRFGECHLEDLERDRSSNYLSFYEFFQNEIDICKGVKAKATISTYDTCLSHIKEFRTSLYFTDINYSLIEGFDRHLRRRGMRSNVIAKYHSKLRFMINQAIKKDMDIPGGNPYVKFTVKSGESRPRVFLTMQEVKRIEELKFNSDEFFLERERDGFLFSCFTALRNETNKVLSIKTFLLVDGRYHLKAKSNKTDKYINIPLNKVFPSDGDYSKPEILLYKYIQLNKDIYSTGYASKPLFGDTCNQVSNKRLKIIAKRAGINKNLTTHVGRHTFGTFMADKISLHYLQAMLQHSKISTTMKYVHLNERLVAEGLDKVKWK